MKIMVVTELFHNEKYNEFVNFLAHRRGELMKESRNTYYLQGLSIFFFCLFKTNSDNTNTNASESIT